MFSRLILILGLCGIVVPGYCEVQQVSAEKLNEMISQKSALTVVDVRSGYDFQKGHIPRAVNAPYNAIEKAGLPKEGSLVLYCGNWTAMDGTLLKRLNVKCEIREDVDQLTNFEKMICRDMEE